MLSNFGNLWHIWPKFGLEESWIDNDRSSNEHDAIFSENNFPMWQKERIKLLTRASNGNSRIAFSSNISKQHNFNLINMPTLYGRTSSMICFWYFACRASRRHSPFNFTVSIDAPKIRSIEKSFIGDFICKRNFLIFIFNRSNCTAFSLKCAQTSATVIKSLRSINTNTSRRQSSFKLKMVVVLPIACGDDSIFTALFTAFEGWSIGAKLNQYLFVQLRKMDCLYELDLEIISLLPVLVHFNTAACFRIKYINKMAEWIWTNGLSGRTLFDMFGMKLPSTVLRPMTLQLHFSTLNLNMSSNNGLLDHYYG